MYSLNAYAGKQEQENLARNVQIECLWWVRFRHCWWRYCTISINLAGHVTRYMPAKILNSAHRGNDRYIHFFLANFYDFFVIFKAFFMTSFYGFSTWPKWLLQLLHFGIFGVAVTCYCQIDRNGTVYVQRHTPWMGNSGIACPINQSFKLLTANLNPI